MVGQERLLTYLDTFTVSTFPKASIFLGSAGSGRHTIITKVATNFNLSIVDITDKITLELLTEIATTATKIIYLIDLDQITIKEQNMLLKILEDTGFNSYFILYAENTNNILPTVLNRCILFQLEPYTITQLNTFLTAEIPAELKSFLFTICNTPGKLISLNFNNLSKIHSLCDTFVNKIYTANYANTLTIKDKINYKDLYDRFDFNLFISSLLQAFYTKYITTGDYKTYYLYCILNTEITKLKDSRLNKENFMIHLLTKLWKGSRKCSYQN